MPRLTVPAALLCVLLVVVTCMKYGEYRTAERSRRVQRMAARGDSANQLTAARRDSELVARRAAIAPACPAADDTTDMSSWGKVTLENSPVTVPAVPSFDLKRSGHSGSSGEMDFTHSDGSWYRVAYGDHEERFEDWKDYELVAECADLADNMPGTIQTARDIQTGLVKLVFASYRLPNGQYVSFRGTTNDVAQQAQFVTVAHHMRQNP